MMVTAEVALFGCFNLSRQKICVFFRVMIGGGLLVCFLACTTACVVCVRSKKSRCFGCFKYKFSIVRL